MSWQIAQCMQHRQLVLQVTCICLSVYQYSPLCMPSISLAQYSRPCRGMMSFKGLVPRLSRLTSHCFWMNLESLEWVTNKYSWCQMLPYRRVWYGQSLGCCIAVHVPSLCSQYTIQFTKPEENVLTVESVERIMPSQLLHRIWAAKLTLRTVVYIAYSLHSEYWCSSAAEANSV